MKLQITKIFDGIYTIKNSAIITEEIQTSTNFDVRRLVYRTLCTKLKYPTLKHSYL